MKKFSLNIHKGTLSTLFFISIFTFTSLSACLLLARTSHAQWAATYGGVGGDEAEIIQQTSDGGYIVAGETRSFGAGGGDLWVLKLDSSGGVQWQKTYGGTNDDKPVFIQQTSDGGYIVVGETSSFGAGDGDFWVLKLDTGGNIQWQKAYGGGGGEEEPFLQQTSDGGYIVTGSTESFGAGGADFWVLKLDSGGDILWQKTYGGSNDDEATSIQQTSDGGYIVAGSTDSFGAGLSDIWVFKLDSNGNIQWQKTYGGTNHDEPFFLQQTSDDGYIVSGETRSFGAGGEDVWVLKLNSSGNVQWQKTYGGVGGEGGMTCQATDGGYIVAGSTESFGAGNEDAWVLKLDSNGNVQWQKVYVGVDEAENIQQTSDGGYIVTGSTESFGAGGADFWVLKLKSDGTIDSSCDFIQDTTVSGIDSNATVTNTNATVSNTNVTPQNTSATVQDTDVAANILCAASSTPDDDSDDDDGSGDDDTKGKSFTFNCDHSMKRGFFFGLETLTMKKGDTENCILKLTNNKPGKTVEVSSLLRKLFRSSIKIEPARSVTDENGELRITLTAISKGTDWAAWAVKNNRNVFSFSKKSYDTGLAWGMFVQVK
ncbi:MAG: hypothetical protein ACUZ8E_03905 [Candidatus Anammoxibacter sp.]